MEAVPVRMTPVSRVLAILAGIVVAGVAAFADDLDLGMTQGLGWMQRFLIIVGVVLVGWGIWGMWAARR
jgi:hypothetical protein